MASRALFLWVHDARFSEKELLIHPDFGARPGHLVEIIAASGARIGDPRAYQRVQIQANASFFPSRPMATK
jgi:hypothetical protein